MKGITSMLGRRGLLAAVTACAALGFASAASAATYTVTDNHDFAQSPTASSGTCKSTAGTCTLRAAVQASNESGGSNTINVPAGTYNVTNASNPGTTPCVGGEDDAVYDLKVNPCNNSTAITVIGAGSGSTVINNSSGSSGNRLWTLYPNGTLDLQKMTLENGNGETSSSSTMLGTYGNGGAVDSAGHFSAESVVFTANSAQSGDYGGAIAAESNAGSTVSANGDVFQNNSAGYGGAVFTDAPEDVSIGFSLMQANNATDGGAVYGCGVSSSSGPISCTTAAASLTLNFDNLIQNVASDTTSTTTGGGALYWDGGGPLNVTNSLFNQNQANGADGGAVFNNSTNVFNVSNSSFDGNSAGQYGGGIYDYESNALNVTQAKFSGNSAASNGGAAYLYNGGGPSTITSSEFDGNQSSGGDGGAIYWYEYPLKLYGDSFVLNTAANGGALYDYDASGTDTLTMIDSTMSRNTASTDGGGIYNDGNATPLTLTNDTIAFNNAASGGGGGIYEASYFTSGASSTAGFGVENTTIAENSGGDCDTSDAFKKSVDMGNNNDSDQTCFGGLGGQNDKTGVNPMLANPANNGGPAAGGPGDTVTVQTDAESASSPTVNAGNNNGCPAVDERGVTRPQGSACDIGAYEFGANPLTTSTTTTGVTSTSTSTSTSTHTTTKPAGKCPKGKHKSGGKCVKNKKHKKKKCPKGKHRKGKKCVKNKKHKK